MVSAWHLQDDGVCITVRHGFAPSKANKITILGNPDKCISKGFRIQSRVNGPVTTILAEVAFNLLIFTQGLTNPTRGFAALHHHAGE